MSDVQQQIKETVEGHPVVLYMKGNPTFPQCGFSDGAVKILKSCNAPFYSVDVLQDMAIREGVKQFANWPTIPQLYIGGEFIGGFDIMREMFEAGELQTKLASVGGA